MTDCTLLDAYLDGQLDDGDARAFESHVLDCDACDAALALPAEAVADLRAMTCPPDVLDAALRTAHRPADRPPVRRARPVVWASLAAAALAVAVWVAVPDGPAPIAATETPAPDVVTPDASA